MSQILPAGETAPATPEFKARELGTDIKGFTTHKFVDATNEEVYFYTPDTYTVGAARSIWRAATVPTEFKYTAGMLRPKSYKVKQILEIDERGVDIFTPLPRIDRLKRGLSRFLVRLAAMVYRSPKRGRFGERIR